MPEEQLAEIEARYKAFYEGEIEAFKVEIRAKFPEMIMEAYGAIVVKYAAEIAALEGVNTDLTARLERAEKAVALGLTTVTNACQILDVAALEWAQENMWSSWDQMVRQQCTDFLREAHALRQASAIIGGK